MNFFITALLTLLLAGCTSPAKIVEHPDGQPIRVTSAYNTQSHEKGNEYLFSIVLPRNGKWTFTENYQPIKKGYFTTESRVFKRSIRVRWNWELKDSPGIKRLIEEEGIYMPWYSGKIGDGSREYYTPTERQISSGDWFSMGYPRKQFIQSMYKGHRQYYCVRSVFQHGGRTAWDKNPAISAAASYSVYDTCPFRTVDGRDANFQIRTGFWVSAEDVSADPGIVDKKLAEIDALLEESWNSLEVMPQAYQFEPPPAINKSLLVR